MSDGNYEDILAGGWEGVPEPKLLPNGSWLLALRNGSFIPKDEDNEKSKARVILFYIAETPMADVDDDKLKELGDYDFENTDLVQTFYIERAVDWARVKRHLALHQGVQFLDSIQETLKKGLKGAKVVGYLSDQTYKDKRTGKMVTKNVITEFASPTE